MPIKDGVVKSKHFHRGKKRNQTIQSIRDKLRNIGLETWIKYHHVLQRVEDRAHRRLTHLYRTAIRSLAELLWDFGVSTVYMEYPILYLRIIVMNITQTYSGMGGQPDGLEKHWRSTG